MPTLLGVVEWKRTHYQNNFQGKNTKLHCLTNLSTIPCRIIVCTILYPLSPILSTKPITVRPCRPGHKPQIKISNLGSQNKTLATNFSSTSLCSSYLHNYSMFISFLLFFTLPTSSNHSYITKENVLPLYWIHKTIPLSRLLHLLN